MVDGLLIMLWQGPKMWTSPHFPGLRVALEQSMDIDIYQLPGILRRRWVYPAAAAVGCGVLAFAFVLHQTPLYHASVELIVDPAGLQNPSTSVNGGQASTQGQLATDSQIYIMQSSEVLGAVVEKLNLQADGWLAPAKTGGLFGGRAFTEDQRKQEAISALREDISVLRADQSLVFTISMKHPSAEKAAEIANAAAEAYLKLTGDSRSGTALRASMSLQAQAEELRQRLQKAQNEVETFKAEHGLYSTTTKGLVADQEIESLSQQIAAANTRVESQKAIYDQAVKLSSADVQSGAIPEALQSTALVSLRTRYAQLLDTEAQLAANLGESHPQLKAARSQTASMRASIEAELSRVRESLKNTYLRSQTDAAALKSRYDEVTRTTGESGDARTRLAQLQSDAQSLKDLYQSYLSKAEELGGKQSVDPGASRIISAAIPPAKAAGAPKMLTLIAGLLFGLVLGSGLAVLRELLGSLVRRSPGSPGKPGNPRHPGNSDDPNKLQKLHDKTGIPVVARIAAPIRRSVGSLLKGHAGVTSGGSQERIMGIARVAEIIHTAFASDVGAKANILFFPVDALAAEQLPFSEIAETLAATGVRVRVANGGADGSSEPMLVRRGPRIALVARPQLDAALWGEGLLHFEQAGQAVPLLRMQGRSKVFYLADAGEAAAQSVLPSLLHGADAIFAVALSSTSKADLEALKSDLAAWQTKLLGMIVIEA
jgi:polysaccharide biosynthesis transport protein